MNKYKDLEQQMSLKKTSSTMGSKEFQEIQSIRKQLNDNLQANKMSAKSKEFQPTFVKKEKEDKEDKKEIPKKTMRVGGQAPEFNPCQSMAFPAQGVKMQKPPSKTRALYSSNTQQNVTYQQPPFQFVPPQPYNTQPAFSPSFQSVPPKKVVKLSMAEKLKQQKEKERQQKELEKESQQKEQEEQEQEQDVGKWEQSIPVVKNDQPKLVSKKEKMRLRQQQHPQETIFKVTQTEAVQQVKEETIKKQDDFYEVQVKAQGGETTEEITRKASLTNNSTNIFGLLSNPQTSPQKKAKRKKKEEEDKALRKQEELRLKEENERKRREEEERLRLEEIQRGEEEQKRKEEEQRRLQEEQRQKEEKEKQEREEKEKQEREEKEKQEREEREKQEREERERKVTIQLSDQLLIKLILQRRQELKNDQNQRQQAMSRLPEVLQVSITRDFKVEIQEQQIERNKNSYESKQYQKGSKYNQGKQGYNKAYNKQSSSANINRQPVDLERQKMQERSGEWLKKMQQEEDEVQKTKKAIGFNLNLLTPDNYDKIKDKIIGLALSSNTTMDTFIQMILEKAWEDKLYVGLYATLCHAIQERQREGPAVDQPWADNKFKTQLLTKIQEVFENQKVTTEQLDATVYEDAEAHADLLRKQKRRILGNIKFIGELYLVKLLPAQIINHVSSMLVVNFMRDYYGYHVLKKVECMTYENHLEALEVLTERIGQKREQHIEQDVFQHHKNAQNKDQPEQRKKWERHQAQLDNAQYFLECVHKMDGLAQRKPLQNYEQMESDLVAATANLYLTVGDVEYLGRHFISKYGLSRRMQSVLEVLFHRRKENWKEIFMQGEGPKTIKQIEQEHLKKQRQMEIETQDFMDRERRHKGPRDRGGRRDRKDRRESPPRIGIQRDKKDQRNTYDNLVQVDEQKERADRQVVLEKQMRALFKQDAPWSEVQALMKEPVIFIKAFLETYFEGALEKVNGRIDGVVDMVKEGILGGEAVQKAVASAPGKYYSLYEDNPHLLPSFANLMARLYQLQALKYDCLVLRLELDPSDPELEDEKENQLYFYKQLIEKAAKSLHTLSLLDGCLEASLVRLCQTLPLEDTSFIHQINKS